MEFLTFLILVIVTTLILRPLQRAMSDRMTELRDYGITRLEEVINRRIEYASMGTSVFGTLDIRNIRISGIDTEPAVEISRLRISYSPWKLLRGELVASVNSILIDKPAIVLDSARDRDLWRLLSSSTDSYSTGIRWSKDMLPENLVVRIRGGECILKDGENSLAADNVTLNFTVEQGRISFQGQWDTDVFLDRTLGRSLEADFSGKIRGEFSDALDNGFVTLNVPAFETDLFALRPLTVNCTLADGKIEIRKIDDQIPLDLHMGYDLASRELSGEFQSENFLLGELFSFSGPWAKYNAWLALRTTGTASLGIDREGKISYDLDLSGIIPAGMSLGMGDTAYTISGTGDQRHITVDKISLTAPLGVLDFSGEIGLDPFAPNGTLSVSKLSLSGDAPSVSGDFSISTEGREFTISGEDLSLGSVLISALDAVIQWEDQGLNFFVSALQFKNMESYEDVQPTKLSLDGSYTFNPRELQVTFFLTSFPLLDIINIARSFGNIPAVPEAAVGLLEDIAVTTEIFITTDFEHLLYNAPHSVVAYGGEQDIFSLFSLSGSDLRLEVEDGRVVWGEEMTMFSGSADFSNLQDISFALRLAYQEMAYYFEGLVLDQRSLSIQGAYGLSVYMAKTDFGGYSGFVETAAFPLPINGQFAWLTLLSSMRYESKDQWSFDISNLEVRELSTPASLTTTLSFRGRGNQDGAWFPELLFNDGRGLLSGGASLAWDEAFSDISGTVSLANPEDAEEFILKGGWSNGALTLNLQLSQFQIGRVIRNSNNILVTGDTAITWNSMDFFLVDFNLSSLTASISETPVHASVSGALTADNFFAENLQISYGGLTAEFSYLRMNNKIPLVETDAHIWGTALGRDMDVSLTARVDFKPLDSWFDINRMLQSFDGRLLVNHIRVNTAESAEPFDFSFSRSESLISLSGGPDEMIQMWLAEDGGFYAGFSNPSPIRGSISGTVADGTINAHSSDLNIDMGSLWSFISTKSIEIPEGIITASLDITGPLADPEFYGIASGTGVRIRIPQFLTEDIGPTPITLLLDGTEMTFGPIDVKVGSGQGRVSGWFRFDRWIPNIFSINIQAIQEQAIPFGVDVGGVRAQGLTSGVLNVSMDHSVLMVTGDLTGRDTEITLDMQGFTDEGAELALASSSIPVVTDLNIRTGSKVEFLWPNADFPIIRAQADRGANLKVKIDTQTDRYTVVGDVKLRSGEIFYIQRSFYLREGTLYFNENEVQFEPLISARAEIREYATEGPVTISLIIDQSPLESFTARFESSPALSQVDIISILGQNLTGTTVAGGSDVLANMLAASSDFLAQFRVVRRLERYVRDFTRLDMFSFRSQVLQNAVLGATRLQVPVDRMSLVSNYFDNTAVFLGKYIGSDMFFQSMLSLRYDENKKTMGGYAFEPEIGIELRSPLFDIRWDFVPRHPEYMFVNDHSITLTWRRTF
ncbi:translocation/assembly module TamB [Treponema sp. TIM-1]|uniref:translocation/assembly module TamB domain-containing protein n=1 Tax=Treponema sp. TIM-1 TaxID=2898417 RepID=UPI00398129D6